VSPYIAFDDVEKEAVHSMSSAQIIGGGAWGPVPGIALARAGIESVIFERSAEPAVGRGSYLTVAPNGLDALRAIGVVDEGLAPGFPTRTNVLVSGTGKMLGAISNGGVLADGTVRVPRIVTGMQARGPVPRHLEDAFRDATAERSYLLRAE
jgi:2-polyprenyl-6-methoxyphenol hydroxylase-like FAD-dependent oxidoreductase